MRQENEREHSLHTLIQNLHVGIIVQGPQAEIRMSNAAAREMLGLTEDQLHGRTSFDPAWNVIHEDGSDFPGPDHPVPQAIATKRAVRGVLMGVFRPTNKDRVWLLVDAEPEIDASGNITQVICTFNNVTARKLAESERDLLFNQSLDLLCVANYFGYFTQVNPAWTRTLGWTASEMTSRPWLEFVHPDDITASENVGYVLVDGRKVLHFENRYRHRDGTYRWLQWNAFPQPDIKTLFGIARDITAQKLAEEKITAQLTELQRWQKVTMDREDRVLELKREVNALLKNAGQPPRYGSAER